MMATLEEVEAEIARRSALREVEAELARREQAARSAALGGPMATPEEQVRLDYLALREAQERRTQELRGRPSALPALPPVTATPEAEERARITTPGGAAEEPYLEAREGVIPFLRPTRIEEVPTPAPLAGPATTRIIREQEPFPARPGATTERAPTATEEFVEAFARQPVLTREAGRQLAAGAEPSTVQRRVGTLEGAVVETPFQAVMRAVPAAMPAAAVEAYRAVGSALTDRTEPIQMTGGAIPAALGEAAAGAIESISPTAARYVRAISAVPERIETQVAPYKRPVQAARAFQEITGVEVPGLQEVGEMRPFIPAPAAVAAKPVSQRIREGESASAVIRSDPQTTAVYRREFGALAPLAMEAMGLAVELPLPLTPLGVVSGASRLARGKGVVEAATEAAAPALARLATARAEDALARAVITQVTPTTRLPTRRLTLDDVRPSVTPQGLPAERADELVAQFYPGLDDLIARARTDLARVAPRTDLVRVSPSYAVPAPLAKRVAAEAAAEVKRVRELTPGLSAKDLGAVRDTAVRQAFGAEARRLDSLGQFQVLLDGLDTPRAWDTSFIRGLQAVADPMAATKRASVVAAEAEVARHGQAALRRVRDAVRTGSAEGQSLDRVLERVANAELRDLPDDEIVRKIIEEAYGGEAARNIYARIRGTNLDSRALIRPEVARNMHELVIREGLAPAASRLPGLGPDFEANALKIILEEGVRKRTSENALAAYKMAYPDSPLPVLAQAGRLGTKEEAKFFENGAEEMFRLADAIPTRAAGTAPTILEAAERVAAAARNAQQKVRLPLVAEARLLAGELAAAPVRALVAARMPVVASADSRIYGVNTPYGYLRPDDITEMAETLGGYGPSQMDVTRRGLLVRDLLLAADRGIGARGLDLAVGAPWAYATADAIEQAFRREVFVQALRRGDTPEAAISLARRSQYDYGAAGDSAVVSALAPYWAGAVTSTAAAREFLDAMAREPGAYPMYVRALVAQQRTADPAQEQGDLPLSRFYAPLPEGVAQDVFGRPLAVLGPEAPALAPMTAPIALARGIAAGGQAAGLLLDGDLVSAALAGSADALDQLAAAASDLASGLGGEAPATPRTVRRGQGGPQVEQTYMSVLATARALDPDRTEGIQDAALRLLEPDVVTPPKSMAAFDFPGARAWAQRPPRDVPGTYVYSETVPVAGSDEQRTVYYVLRPSKVGRQRIQTLLSAPLAGAPLGDAVRIAGTALESGVPEAVLWAVGAETVEAPTRQVVEQVR